MKIKKYPSFSYYHLRALDNFFIISSQINYYMILRTFRGEKSKYEPECRQLLEIYSLLSDYPSEEMVFIASNFRLASGEIDCLIVKENGPILLELKAYQGEIFGCENGDWSVRSHNGEIVPMQNNVFHQADRHRLDFLNKWQRIAFIHLSEIIPQKELRWVQSWAYFKPGSRYCDSIDFDKIPWFRIVTSDTLIPQFDFIRTSYCLYPKDIELVMKELGLSEAPINQDIAPPQDDTFTEYLQFAQIHYDAKDYPAAQRFIEKCLQINPGNKEALQLAKLDFTISEK